MKAAYILLLISLLYACSPSDETARNSASYFDLEEQLQLDLERYASDYVLVRRSQWNDIEKYDTLDSVNWEEQLYPVLNVPVKPAVWSTDFKLTDSSWNGQELTRSFKSTNDYQRLKEFTLVTNGSQLIRFEGMTEEHNKLTQQVDRISYTPNVGYTFAGFKETRVMGKENYKIIGQFIRK